MKVAVCDDDVSFIKKIVLQIKKYIREVDEIVTFNNGKDLLSETDIDILFVDIEMPNLTGFDLVDNLENDDIIVIFVSSYNDKVYESIKYSPFRFIRKDRLHVEFEEAITSAIKRANMREKEFLIEVQGSTRKIIVGDIYYIESNLKKSKIVLDGELIEFKSSFKDLEDNVVFDNFVKSHRSYLVNLAKIVKIDKNDLILNNGITVPLSRTKKNEIKSKFINYVRSMN